VMRARIGIETIPRAMMMTIKRLEALDGWMPSEGCEHGYEREGQYDLGIANRVLNTADNTVSMRPR